MIRRVRARLVVTVVVVVNAVPAYGQLRDAVTQELTSADGVTREIITGFVRVPELRSITATSNVDLAVVRVHRPGTSSRSAHILLAGGPGDSGVNLVMQLVRQGDAATWALFDGDVVGIDQRGTGRSRPNLDTPARYELPLDKPASVAEWLPRIDGVMRSIAAEFRSKGIRLEAYNTRESADDIAAVRTVLGYERVTLWGRSYGSHLALATVARHPTIVDRLILVSPEGPNHTWKLPSQVDAVIRRLEERGAPDLERHLRRVLSRLAAQPATVKVKNPASGAESSIVIGPFDVQWIVAQALGDPRLIATLPMAVREMAQGQFERVAQIVLVRRSRAGVESAMKHMMDLSSGASIDRRRRIDEESRTALLGNAINFPGMFVTDAWSPVMDLGDEFRRPVRSATPTLILVGDLDPRTPMTNAQEIATSLTTATILVLENATHQFDMFGSAAIRTAVGQFLRGESIAVEKIVLPKLGLQ